jgi:hypothetical protein
LKLLSTFLLCIVLCAVTAWPRSALAQDARNDPHKIVSEFYAWYLHEIGHDNSNPLKKRTVALRYLAPTLLADAPRLSRRMDADIFICAQDWLPEWEKKFMVAPVAKAGARLTTVVTLPSGETDQIKIRVTLTKLKEGWRISRVQCAN